MSNKEEGFVHPADEFNVKDVSEKGTKDFRESLDKLLEEARNIIRNCSDDDPPHLLAIVGIEDKNQTLYLIDSYLEDYQREEMLVNLHNYFHKHRMEGTPSIIHPEELGRNLILPVDMLDKRNVKAY